MVISVRKWLERARFILLFLAFTLLFSQFADRFRTWVEPDYRYVEPTGQAVKVSETPPHSRRDDSFGERLRFFYWYGE